MEVSAVEFLLEKIIWKDQYHEIFLHRTITNELIEQAKEIENKKAHEYAIFAIRCDRENMKILNFEDWIKL